MFSHCFLLYLFELWPSTYYLIFLILLTLLSKGVNSVNEKWYTNTQTHNEVEYLFYSKYLPLFIALFIALTATSSSIGRRLDLGKKRQAEKTFIAWYIYPFPFLFLLDFFLGRTISIHFWNFAPNIATLIYSWRAMRAR